MKTRRFILWICVETIVALMLFIWFAKQPVRHAYETMPATKDSSVELNQQNWEGDPNTLKPAQ